MQVSGQNYRLLRFCTAWAQQLARHCVLQCRPQRLLMVAIDGVAPQAKMCQQRTRRFMSAHTERLRKGIEKEVSAVHGRDLTSY